MADATFEPKVYKHENGDRMVVASGGSLDVESGGEINIETGGAIKINGSDLVAELSALDGVVAGTVTASKAVIVGASKNIDTLVIADGGLKLGAGAGTAVTSTAAELNVLDAVAAGTVSASKAVVVGANKNIDTLAIADGGLKLGAGAGTAVTSTAAELNKLDGAALGTHTFTVGAEGGNVINVAIQLRDANAADLAARGSVFAYLSDDANGDSVTATAPDGGVVIGTDGLAIPVTPALNNSLLVDGALAISATAEKFKTTQTAAFLVGGVSHTKAATDDLVFTAAHVITASKFGVILVQINAAGTVSTKVPASPQAYDDAPTALAALPSADAGNVALGYIAIENNAGDWTANTDDLTNASDVTTAAFNDATEVAIASPKAWQLTSESDGDIDINITESGVATWYLVLVNPQGSLQVSGAITFA